MGEAAFFHRACVGSGLRALDRISHLIGVVRGAADPARVLGARPCADMFTAAEQIDIAIGFTLRLAMPPAGCAVPEMGRGDLTVAGLEAHVGAARKLLKNLALSDYAGAGQRRVRHRAGFADLDQAGQDYIFDFALPNLAFHVTAAYLALKGAGLALGKADFDGVHSYPVGFSFVQDDSPSP